MTIAEQQELTLLLDRATGTFCYLTRKDRDRLHELLEKQSKNTEVNNGENSNPSK